MFRKIAWVFFGLYTAGLLLSVSPILFQSFALGLLAFVYVAIAQGWIVWANRKGWTSFWKSNLFHLIPMAAFAYIVITRLFAEAAMTTERINAERVIGTLSVILFPVLVLIMQSWLLKRSHGSGPLVQPD